MSELVTPEEAALVRKILATTGRTAPMNERQEARRIVDRLLPPMPEASPRAASFPKTNEQRLAAAVEVIREVLERFHGDHNWPYWAQKKLDLALHQADGCSVYRKDCPWCVGAHVTMGYEERSRDDAEMWCDRCKRRHGVVWAAPSDLWNLVMREGDRGKPDEFNFCCPICFMQLADERGVGNFMWGAQTWEPATGGDFATVVHEIREKLVELQNAPHEEHAGPVCPICVLTNRMLARLQEQSDA